jgi:hypothetical protein
VIVAAVFQFYFENLLPTDESWPERFTVQFEDYRVNIEPRLPSDALFPEDVDRTLASTELRLTPVSRPGGSAAVRMRDRILDRIKATVVKEDVEQGEDGSLPERLEDDFLDAAVDAIDGVFAHARVLSDALFVEGVRRAYRLEDGQSLVLSPHTISWFGGEDAADLKRLTIYPGGANATGSSGAIRSPERGAVDFQSLSASIAAHPEGPPLPESLLVTAQERLTQLFVREAIVALATACEVASDHYLERTGRANERSVRAILNASNLSFAEKRLHRVPQLVSNRSFRVEQQREFDDVQRLYRTRNNVAHAGDLSYSEAGATTTIDQKVASGFLVAAHKAVDWLAKL